MELAYRPPFAVAMDDRQAASPAGRFELLVRHAARAALARLERRQWACPAGTGSCEAIGYPNSCCPSEEACVEVQDTGLGPVGCCPAGATCGGGVSGCSDGSMPCGSDIGGGCCIPGFVCQGVGCEFAKVSISTIPNGANWLIGVRLPPSSSSSSSARPTAPPRPTITSASTSIIDRPTPSTVTGTASSTSSPRPTTSPNTGVGAPYRPTSSSVGGGDDPSTYCPTGFYACLASAGGGCCQTGRDCQTTSCPPVSKTTLINTNGITVVAPATEMPAATTDLCAAGWFLCGDEAGPLPGCCPSGYSCGTASCSAETAGATATVAKALPSAGMQAAATAAGWWWVLAVAGALALF